MLASREEVREEPRRVVGSAVTMRCPVCRFTRSVKSLRKELDVAEPSVAVEMWVRTVQKGVKGLRWEALTPRRIDDGAREHLTRMRAKITVVMLEWLYWFACRFDGAPLTVTVHGVRDVAGLTAQTFLRTPSRAHSLPASPSSFVTAPSTLATPTFMEQPNGGT